MTRSFLATALATLFLTACGSGGSGGGDAPAPMIVTGPVTPTTPFTPQPEPVAMSPVTTPPGDDPMPVVPQPGPPSMVADADADPDPDPDPDPDADPDADPEPIIDEPPRPIDMPPAPVADTPALDTPPAIAGSLADLLGRVTIDSRFTGGTVLFSISATFGAANLSNDVLISRLASRTLQTGAGPVRAGSDATLACSRIESLNQFACIEAEQGPNPTSRARTFYRFDDLSDGTSTGSFVFCTGGMVSATCSERLVLAPDGGATLRVDPSLASRSRPIAGTLDPTPYRAYAAQGVPAPAESPVDAATAAEIDALAEAYAGLR